MQNKFILEYKATIGVDFLTKEIQKEENLIILQMWDTAGTERYDSITESFFRNSETCVLVFDLTSEKSFNDVEIWRKKLIEKLDQDEREKYPFVLLGNKSDLKDQIEVKDEVIQQYCIEHNSMPYFSVSAKTFENVEEAFAKVADIAFERNIKNKQISLPEVKPIQVTKQTNKRKCCFS